MNSLPIQGEASEVPDSDAGRKKKKKKANACPSQYPSNLFPDSELKRLRGKAKNDYQLAGLRYEWRTLRLGSGYFCELYGGFVETVCGRSPCGRKR